MPDEVQIRRWFPAVPEAIPQARGWVAQVAAATGHAAVAPTVEVLVSELATNAVRYSGAERFLVEFDANRHIVVAVCDPSWVAPVIQDPPETAVGGRGLAIADKLADQWGVELRRNGKCLWFKLSDPPSSPSA